MGNKQQHPVHKEYEFLRKVGSGSYASVYKVRRVIDNRIFACKVIKKTKLNKKELKLAEGEIRVMRAVNHPNVVRMYDIFDDDRKVYMILEYLRGGSLLDAIQDYKTLSEERISDICRDVASGLAYCHQLGIVHRDLKPENLMLETKKRASCVKITDFGLAKFVRHTEFLHTVCGTPSYVAPEILVGSSRAEYTNSVDMWSFGVVVYMLLTGDRPFPNVAPKQLFKMIREGLYRTDQTIWDMLSNTAKDLVARLLIVDPKRRLSAKKVLMHPFLLRGVPKTHSLGDRHYRKIMKIRAIDKLRRVVNLVIVCNRFKRLLSHIEYEWTSVYEAPTVLTRSEIETMRNEKMIIPELIELDRIRSVSAGSRAQARDAQDRMTQRLLDRGIKSSNIAANNDTNERISLREERRAKMNLYGRYKYNSNDDSIIHVHSGKNKNERQMFNTPTPKRKTRHRRAYTDQQTDDAVLSSVRLLREIRKQQPR